MRVKDVSSMLTFCRDKRAIPPEGRDAQQRQRFLLGRRVESSGRRTSSVSDVVL